jgi:hypothetical protein
MGGAPFGRIVVCRVINTTRDATKPLIYAAGDRQPATLARSLRVVDMTAGVVFVSNLGPPFAGTAGGTFAAPGRQPIAHMAVGTERGAG